MSGTVTGETLVYQGGTGVRLTIKHFAVGLAALLAGVALGCMGRLNQPGQVTAVGISLPA